MLPCPITLLSLERFVDLNGIAQAENYTKQFGLMEHFVC